MESLCYTLKLAQHCKSPIFQYKIKIKLKKHFKEICLNHRIYCVCTTFCGIAHPCDCFPGWGFAHITLWPSISNTRGMGRGKRRYSSLLFSLCFCFTHTVYFRAGLLLLANTSLHTGTTERIQSGRGIRAGINFVQCKGFLECWYSVYFLTVIVLS